MYGTRLWYPGVVYGTGPEMDVSAMQEQAEAAAWRRHPDCDCQELQEAHAAEEAEAAERELWRESVDASDALEARHAEASRLREEQGYHANNFWYEEFLPLYFAWIARGRPPLPVDSPIDPSDMCGYIDEDGAPWGPHAHYNGKRPARVNWRIARHLVRPIARTRAIAYYWMGLIAKPDDDGNAPPSAMAAFVAEFG